MQSSDAVVAIYSTHPAVDAAVKRLTQADFSFKNISVIGKGYHTEEKAVGFYTVGDRVKFWGERGAFWGGLWSLFLGGIFMTVPVVGQVVVLGYVATMAIAAVEGAIMVGGLSALAAAIFSVGIPRESAVKYEATLKSDGFMLMVHGSAQEVERAKALLEKTESIEIHQHSDITSSHSEEAIAL